eukprot:COSAG01_NODE_7795_length_3053_cov_29.913676_1_plen_186_part_00
MSGSAAVTALKAKGNDAFRAGDFAMAKSHYAEALALLCRPENESSGTPAEGDDLTLALRSNSAECHLRLDDWEAAHAAATAALALNPGHVKSLARQKRAQMALDMLQSLPPAGPTVAGVTICTQAERRRAVRAMLTLRRPELSMAERATCIEKDGVQDDRLFDLMALMVRSTDLRDAPRLPSVIE